MRLSLKFISRRDQRPVFIHNKPSWTERQLNRVRERHPERANLPRAGDIDREVCPASRGPDRAGRYRQTSIWPATFPFLSGCPSRGVADADAWGTKYHLDGRPVVDQSEFIPSRTVCQQRP